MKLIPVATQFAIVDDADYEHLSQFTWYLYAKPRSTSYAQRNIGPKKKRIYMHREIMNPPAGIHVDHRDGNGLNNQRSNLRLATSMENQRNRTKTNLPTSSRYKGVSYKSANRKWTSSICLSGKLKYLGIFESEIDAAKCYDAAAIEHFGEFARLNFPESGRAIA